MKRIPTVKFDTSRLTRAVLADLERNIRDLPEVAEQNFDDVYDVALRSIAAGGDLYMLSTGLVAMNIDGMTSQRAAQISKQLWFRAKEIMDREQQAELGITEAQWMYSHAPCMIDPRKPTSSDLLQDAAHKAANGKIYRIADGMLMNGRRTWPGREYGCKCSSKPRIFGFED